MMKKKKDDNNYTFDLNAIFGKGSEEKRMADKVLDRKGVPNNYKHQYVAEKNMKAESAAYLKRDKENMIGGPSVNPSKGPKSRGEINKTKASKRK